MAYLSPLQRVRTTLPEELTRFVLEGERAELLDELPTISYQGELRLGPQLKAHPTREALFARAELNPKQWMRLGTLWSRIPKLSPEEASSVSRGDNGAYPGALDLLLREAELSKAGDESPFRSTYLFAEIVRSHVEFDSSYLHYHWFISETAQHFLALSRYPDFSKYWQEQFPVLQKEFSSYLDFAVLRFVLPCLHSLPTDEQERVHAIAKPLIDFRLRESASPVGIASALESMLERGYDLERYGDRILGIAMQRDEYMSDTARYILKHIPERALAHMAPLLREGPPKMRARAALSLSAIQSDAAFEILEAHLPLEKSKAVKSAIQYCLDCREALSFRARVQSEKEALLAHAQTCAFNTQAPLPQEARQLLRKSLERVKGEDGLAESYFESFLHCVETLELDPSSRAVNIQINAYRARIELEDFIAHPAVNLLHLARLVAILGKTRIDEEDEIEVDPNTLDELVLSYAKTRQGLCALDLLAAFVLMGADAVATANALICTLKQDGWDVFERAQLNAFLCDRPYLFIGPLRLQSSYLDLLDRDREERAPGFVFLSDMENIPKCLQNMILFQAFEAADDVRSSMQLALSKVPDIEQQVCAHLNHAAAKKREYAAEWLAMLAKASTAPAIRTRLEKEKNALVRSALQLALDSMKESSARSDDPESLLEQAIASSPKRMPAAMQAFPFELLPPLRWRASGEKIDFRILKAWILYAFQKGEAKPDEELQHYLDLVAADDAEHWGKAIFLAWILADPKLPIYLRWQKLSPEEYLRQHWDIPGTDFDSVLDWFETQALAHEGSIAPRKGLLALVAASNSSGAAIAAKEFVLHNSSDRLAHCRAILAALSFMETDSALATISEVSYRVHSTPVRKSAQDKLLALAQRRGWTRSQLHDRIIPRAGLDQKGELELRAGEQSLTLLLDQDLKLKYRSAKGQLRARLPAKAKGESDHDYESRKAAISRIRREIKSAAKLQLQRLDDAMILQRSWSTQEWKRDLAEHPILSKLITRIIWNVQEEDKETIFFRPLDDQSLSTIEDESLSLPAKARIRIAHANHMSEAQRMAWRQHARDYELDLALEQLSELPPAPTPAESHNELAPKEKLKVGLFHLQQSAKRWGFERDSPIDSRRFVSYSRSFPEVGIRVKLYFSGADLPMKAQEVEVECLCAYFTDACSSKGLIPLRDFPGLLLAHSAQALRATSECPDVLARKAD